jgi:NAD(P)H-nitrite reductase large subunit
MAKFGLLTTLTALIAALSFASMSEPRAGDACKTTKFSTEMVRDACKAGGQDKAKEVMKEFNKANKIKSCNQCHVKLAPSYELKADGLEQFKKLGGK